MWMEYEWNIDHHCPMEYAWNIDHLWNMHGIFREHEMEYSGNTNGTLITVFSWDMHAMFMNINGIFMNINGIWINFFPDIPSLLWITKTQSSAWGWRKIPNREKWRDGFGYHLPNSFSHPPAPKWWRNVKSENIVWYFFPNFLGLTWWLTPGILSCSVPSSRVPLWHLRSLHPSCPPRFPSPSSPQSRSPSALWALRPGHGWLIETASMMIFMGFLTLWTSPKSGRPYFITSTCGSETILNPIKVVNPTAVSC